MSIRLTVIIILLTSNLATFRSSAIADEPTGDLDQRSPEFESDVRPVFAKKCGQCHSRDVQKGDLDLSSMKAIRSGGESGETLVADSLDESRLWSVIVEKEMPPEGEPKLSPAETDLLRRWIQSGAKSSAPQPTERKITQHDVLPIVLLRCVTCHGPRLAENGLDMRTVESMLKGGKSGPALVPGNPDESLMMERIESEACPPRESLLKYFVRRPGASEIQMLKDWIASGAPVVDTAPDVATNEPDPLVTEEEREHWAFQPPVRSSNGNSVDDFISRKLTESGLSFAPQADRDTLIRRVYMDLIGMPPTTDQWQRWHDHDASDWYQQMLEEVLASPHYGERWGRYWLDLAGYADSEGGISADPIRPVAWRYRDYVIKSFNEDKPYDRFLLEQLAGDELIDHQSAKSITEQMVENMVATGFLRMGIDETGSRTMNFVPERLKVISDAITVVSSGLMGLTMECARCHSHKYDPIPQRDYYRLKAIFQGALDEHDWSTFKNRKVNLATPRQRERIAATNPPLEKQIKKQESAARKIDRQIQLLLLRHHYPDQSEEDNESTIAALRIADNNRTLPQRRLVERLQVAEIIPEDQQPQAVVDARAARIEIDRQIQRIRRKMVTPATIRALWDFGRPSPTYILRRGEHDKPGRLVGPGVPSVLTDGKTPLEIQPPFPNGTPKTGRRLAFARWLTQPDHPLTARVMVNRIWKHHFRVGLVKDLDNFGRRAEGPSHPELLDWLAIEFVDRGWSIKNMHRLMMNSQTYRQSSRVTEQQQKADPQNRLLSRMPLRRLDAESIRDSLLFISGKLETQPGGIPDAVTVDQHGQVNVFETEGGGWRRSIYLQYRRTEIPTMMDTFDYPQMGPNCVVRSESTVSPQALLLINNRHVRLLASAFADRVASLTRIVPDSEDASDSGDGDSIESQVDRVYQIALTRLPSETEKRVGVEAIETLKTQWGGDHRKALETYCHAIINSAAFLYVD